MLEIVRAKVIKTGLSEKVKLECGDAVELPFRTGFFDAIFMSFTIALFDTSEIPKVLYECQKVLRTDGRICVVSLSKKGESSWMRKLYEWGRKKIPKPGLPSYICPEGIRSCWFSDP